VRDPYTLLLCGIMGFGIALRVRQWWHDRSLHIDEAAVVQNLDAKSGMELTRPLHDGQIAPHGWLWLVDLTNGTGLADERTLRIVPLILGCATLVAVAALAAVALRSRLAQIVAVALAAIAPWLIVYSNTVKQYSADAFVVTTLLLLTVLAVRAPTSTRRIGWWAAAATIGVWLSQAAILVVPALGGLLLVAAARRGRQQVITFLAFAAPAAVSLLVELRLMLANVAASIHLDDFWARTYAPDPLTLDGLVEWLGRTGTNFVHIPLAMRNPLLVLALVLAGFAAVAVRNDLPTAVVLAVPAVVSLLAGLLRVYPPAGRVVLFVVPAVLVLLAGAVEGAIAAADRLWRARSAPPVLALCLGLLLNALLLVTLVAAPAAAAVPKTLLRGKDYEEVANAFALAAKSYQPGDAVVVKLPITQFAHVYSPRYHLAVDGAISARPSRRHCDPRVLPQELQNRKRIWFINGHSRKGEDAAVDLLSRQGEVAMTRRWPRARLVLVDLPAAPRSRAEPAVPSVPHLPACLQFSLLRPID
jgi:hypothetical protein